MNNYEQIIHVARIHVRTAEHAQSPDLRMCAHARHVILAQLAYHVKYFLNKILKLHNLIIVI